MRWVTQVHFYRTLDDKCWGQIYQSHCLYRFFSLKHTKYTKINIFGTDFTSPLGTALPSMSSIFSKPMTVRCKIPGHAPVGLNLTATEELKSSHWNRAAQAHATFPLIHFKQPGKGEAVFCSACWVYKGRGTNSCFWVTRCKRLRIE